MEDLPSSEEVLHILIRPGMADQGFFCFMAQINDVGRFEASTGLRSKNAVNFAAYEAVNTVTIHIQCFPVRVSDTARPFVVHVACIIPVDKLPSTVVMPQDRLRGEIFKAFGDELQRGEARWRYA